jgi:hypothetical protein
VITHIDHAHVSERGFHFQPYHPLQSLAGGATSKTYLVIDELQKQKASSMYAGWS